MGLLGIMAAIWSVKFDHIAAVSNFVIMPMTFLSGTFYLVDRLPEPFRTASHFNPFFYLIAGFRYGFIGHSDGSILVGVATTGGAGRRPDRGLPVDVRQRIPAEDLDGGAPRPRRPVPQRSFS